jgi:2-hydroxy-3-oxopropionate reductase
MAAFKTIGFVGVGVMGGPMARRLIENGASLVVHDPDAAAVARLTSLGARQAASPREVADHADVVLTSLPSPAILKQVVLGQDGVLQGRAMEVFIDLSTVGSVTAREVAGALAARNVPMVDAPVTGGAAGARSGKLTVMVAGPEEALQRASGILEIFGKVIKVSNQPGHAQLLKLLNNMLSSTAFAITSEAFVAGTKAGLDPEVMLSVINAGSGRNGATQDKFPKHVLPGTFDFGFPVSSVYKDIGLAVSECEALGVPLWIGNTVRQLWQAVYLQGGAKRDMTELVAYIEQWSAPAKNA